jgi:UDP-N-acetylglucosamine 1-carboxyvinyltransferase
MSLQTKIATFIKTLREQKDMTQTEFAELLGTSQSAVARMEKGEQNFSTEMLTKISQVLNHKILSLKDSVDFKIEGGRKLSGTIQTNTSKNGAMGLLCASLLNRGKTILHGIPRIEEVNRILEVMESVQIQVRWIGPNSLEITPPKEPKDLNLANINTVSAKKTRTILMFIGPLIHLFKNFSIPNSQGCKLGKRSITAHLFALERLGVKIKTTNTTYDIKVGELKPAEIVMYEAGDTAMENVLIAAAKIPGKTLIKFGSANYMVQEVANFLTKLGVRIDGIGTTTMIVYGINEIDQNVEYTNSEDPTESMMLLTAAIITQSTITITRCPIDFLELELLKLEKMGFKYSKTKSYVSHNGLTKLVDITTNPSEKPFKLKALPDKIHSQSYPGINMDNLPFFVPIAAMAEGTTLIHDWSYENRAIYFMELTRLGASMILADPHRVYIDGFEGDSGFQAAQVVCPPALRPATIILLAMLGAKGNSILRNVYSINRGYEQIAERLNSIGAKITIIQE